MNTRLYLLERPLSEVWVLPASCFSWSVRLLPAHPYAQPSNLLHPVCCFSFKWTVGFFYFIQVLDSPYRPHSFGGCQLVLSTDVSFLMLPFFFPYKEKEPLRQQASPEWKIKNPDITYLAALLPTGLCKTQLNVSPLNTALQYIKQKILQAWWQSLKPRLRDAPCSLL